MTIDCMGGAIAGGMGDVNPIIHFPSPGGLADQPAKLWAAIRLVQDTFMQILATKAKNTEGNPDA